MAKAVLFFVVALSTPSLALDRRAFSFPFYDLQVHIDPHRQWIAAEGTVELRNLSNRPQSEAALQISSSLRWLSVQLNGAPAEWLAQSYTSDVDHTGLLSEAIVKFERPLAPGQSLRLNVRYSGTVARDTTRLERIGTPREIAVRSDWDQIADGFTALRGVGFVAWYPVAMEAASLSQGNELFETLRDWRERQSAAVLRIKLQLEAAEGNDPRVLFVGNGNPTGERQDGTLHGKPDGTPDGTRTVLAQEFRGVEPVIVMLRDAASTTDRASVAAYYTAAHTSLARDYMAAVEAVTPPLAEWFDPHLSAKPKRKVVLVELADRDALPYQAGPYYFVPLREVPHAAAEVAMARPVAASMLESPRPWVRDGLAAFAQALIRERQAGRGAALDYLGQFGSALAVAEAQSHGAEEAAGPASTSNSTSNSAPGDASAARPQPLVVTADEIFLHTKAAYVWWMLRDMIGEAKLQAALASYRAAEDRDSGYVQRLIEQQFSPRRDLEAFFDDWVYRDPGLPQLRIVSAQARRTLGEQTVTAVTVENLGEAGCEVPVIVRSASVRAEARARLLVPAKGKAIVRVPLNATPTEVEVNDGSVPESPREKHVVPVVSPPA